MNAHEKRVEKEWEDLLDKIDKLAEFINNNPVFQTLEDRDRELLVLQHRHMNSYFIVLEERLNRFEKE